MRRSPAPVQPHHAIQATPGRAARPIACNRCRYRTARLLRTVAQRLRKHTPRLGAFQAWNKCLNHLLALARAHVESVMLTSILEGCNACPDADSRKSLKVGVRTGMRAAERWPVQSEMVKLCLLANRFGISWALLWPAAKLSCHRQGAGDHPAFLHCCNRHIKLG